jgi:hypothetical protein
MRGAARRLACLPRRCLQCWLGRQKAPRPGSLAVRAQRVPPRPPGPVRPALQPGPARRASPGATSSTRPGLRRLRCCWCQQQRARRTLHGCVDSPPFTRSLPRRVRACQRQALFPRPLLTVWPCVAALQATEIFGSDGDAPPSFAEQWAAKVGKTMDKNFIDKRRPPPVRCGRT